MTKGWRIGGADDDVVITQRSSDLPHGDVMSPATAAWRVDDWYPETWLGTSTETALEDAFRAIEGVSHDRDRGRLKETLRRAFLEGRLVAVRIKVMLSGAAVMKEPEAREPEQPTEEKRLVDLWVRVDIRPSDAASNGDRFVVTSTDGAYSQTKTVKDDLVPGDESIDLEFVDLYADKRYNLQVIPARGSPHYVFQDVAYSSLGGLGPPPTAPYQARANDPLPEEAGS